MPHWLVFVISVLALGVPIGGLLFMVWLAVVRPTGFVITPVELAYIAVATILIAAVMASYAHRKQRPLP
jgi:membrane protein implicated in regulation of membrane protease activity